MIGQFLSQTNEIATVPILQNFLELNKAIVVVEHIRTKEFFFDGRHT